MNLDKLKRFPNQNEDHRYTECVGESRADIIGNIVGIPMDPDFSYSSDLRIQRATPTDAGEEIWAGLCADHVYGALPDANDRSDPAQTSQLTEANWDNYTEQQKELAAHFRIKGYPKQLSSFEEIKDYMDRQGWGVFVSFKWYDSFSVLNQDATMPAPIGRFSYHQTAAYGYDDRGLRIKSWQGPERGEGGYEYCSKATLGLSATGVFAYDPTYWPWLGLVRIALQYPKAWSDISPLLWQERGKMKSV